MMKSIAILLLLTGVASAAPLHSHVTPSAGRRTSPMPLPLPAPNGQMVVQ